MYAILSLLFVLTVLFSAFLLLNFSGKYSKRIRAFGIAWFLSYAVFVLFFTGPENLSRYPEPDSSPYKLPWAAGISRFVAQGNRSFTTHRDLHLYAWDFAMPVGTPVIASRDGVVVHVEVNHDGFQPLANYILIQHADGDQTGYAHLKKNGSLVKVGDHVLQGQSIGFSGRVGIALFPHLHFYATTGGGKTAKPISFREVSGGVPFAGHFYTSENIVH